MALERNPAEQFGIALTNALKHCNDPQWLGQYSPFATPYFLGSNLHDDPAPETTSGRGRTLQKLLHRAADSMWPGEPPQSQGPLLTLVEQERSAVALGSRYQFLLLDLRYMRRYFPPRSPPNTVGAMYDMLNVSETRFFAHLHLARNSLAQELLRLVRPSLRLERPQAPNLVGRDQLLHDCSVALLEGRSVALTGTAGIGKTSVGAELVNRWPTDAVFWHTFRPGLNDNLTSVVQSLAHFLHQNDCPNLWLQLMAMEGELTDLQQILGFLREDLDCASELPALLCFDEVDLLHTASAQPRHGTHKQLLELLDGLRDLAPLLLIGQRALIDTDTHHELQPLSLAETTRLLARAGLPVNTARRLHTVTEGNPRFLELYIALQIGNETDRPSAIAQDPSLHPLFNRLWKRLSKCEKEVLMSLSVFRAFAPRTNWQEREGFESLQARNLLKEDTQGGVALLSLFRELVYDELSSEQQQQVQQQAALIRAQLGQYTEAAFHLWQADLRQEAVDLWYDYQDIEIEQGKAGAAHALFADASSTALPETCAKRLKVIQDRLNLLYGDAASVLDNIDGYSWHMDEQITADAMEQWGQAHLIRGDLDATLAQYDSAIDVLGRISTNIVQLHRKRAQVHIEQAHLEQAQRETIVAQFEVERLKAWVLMAQGDNMRAQKHLQTALQMAEEVSDTKLIGLTKQLLAIAAGNHGDFPAAYDYAQDAMAYFESMGDRLSLENMRAEVAGFLLNQRRFAEAIAPHEAALSFFEEIKHDIRIAYISSNLAEAYFETGQLEKAEAHALRAIQSENPRVQPYACYTLGQIRHSQKRIEESEQVFKRGVRVAEQTGDDFIAAYLYRAYGTMQSQEGRTEAGVQTLEKSRERFAKLTMEHEVEITAKLIEHYSATK